MMKIKMIGNMHCFICDKLSYGCFNLHKLSKLQSFLMYIKSGDEGLGNLGRLSSIHRASKELSLGLTTVGLVLNTADY